MIHLAIYNSHPKYTNVNTFMTIYLDSWILLSTKEQQYGQSSCQDWDVYEEWKELFHNWKAC